MPGEYLLHFFESRQSLSFNSQGEASVLCPFEHAKGLEERPSAHINTDKALFHCKTCAAEGRFSEGGLSEAGFVMRYYNTSYSKAIKMIRAFETHHEEVDDFDQAIDNLKHNTEAMKWLNDRGIDAETVEEYHLGYDGEGITYPVIIHGILVDKRTYYFNREPGEPKVKSESKAQALLFPFDAWFKDGQDTLLCAGENDALLARKMGFNAITSTLGEASFPDIFLSLFTGKTVHICLDCDEAGRKAARSVGFKLKESGASVYIVNLGLDGTKEDKDITDFFIKHSYTHDNLLERIAEAVPYSNDMLVEDKNAKYPLVDLWNIPEGEHTGKYLSSRVMMMGKFETAFGSYMEVPGSIEWAMEQDTTAEKPCECWMCRQKTGWWVLEDENLGDVLHLVEVDETRREKHIMRMLKQPGNCTSTLHKWVREKKYVQKVIFSPDVETEDELRGYQSAEMIAYVIDSKLSDGMRYRIYFRRYPHPKNQAIVLVVDKVEESDNNINKFQITPEVIHRLEQFQGDPSQVMEQRYDLAKQIVGTFAPREVVEAVNIVYHSVLDFKYAGRSMKGHPDALVIGPTRTGKSQTAKKLNQFYGVGNMTDLKSGTTVAGLLGGAESIQGGGHRIRWGIIPRNHKGLIILDEMSGVPRDVMARLTAARSEREVRISKIVSGKAPAYTRLLWVSNPRVQSDGGSRNISLYPTGIQIIQELVGEKQDISRFDFIVILPENESYISPFSEEELKKYDNPDYRLLIHWVWSRTQDQVKFAEGVEEYIWQVAQELNERYDSDVGLFGSEANKKLARIAVSVAGMCFSNTDDGNFILVEKSHVDWASNFMVRCYDNNVFRIRDYVEQYKATMTTNEEVNNVFTSLANAQPLLIKAIDRTMEISLNQLQMVTGLERQQFSEVVATMVRNGLIELAGSGSIARTPRFRKAKDAYKNNIDKQKLTPLSERGVGI